MIDININAILSQALAAAVQQAIQPLQQEYANKMAEMAQQIAALEMRLTLGEKLTPAQGVDTTLEQRIAALEKHTAVLDQHGGLLEYLDNQEWFWEKIRRFADGVVESAVEQAIQNHTDMYDHNDFVTEDKLDDYVKTENLESEVCDAVRDIMESATVSIRI